MSWNLENRLLSIRITLNYKLHLKTSRSTLRNKAREMLRNTFAKEGISPSIPVSLSGFWAMLSEDCPWTNISYPRFWVDSIQNADWVLVWHCKYWQIWRITKSMWIVVFERTLPGDNFPVVNLSGDFNLTSSQVRLVRFGNNSSGRTFSVQLLSIISKIIRMTTTTNWMMGTTQNGVCTSWDVGALRHVLLIFCVLIGTLE